MAAYFHSSFAGNVQTQLIHGYVPREPSSDDEPTQPIRGYVRKQPRPGYLQRQPIRGYVQSQPNPGYTGVPLGQIQPALLQVQAVGPQSTQVRDEIPHRQRLRILGIIQMVAGSVCFFFEVIGLIVGPIEYVTGVGIWAGVFFFLPGLLSLLAAHLNNRRLLVACLVMCIIGSIVACIGISLASVEIDWFNYYHYDYEKRFTFGADTTHNIFFVTSRQLTYEHVKASINIMVCIMEFVVTIISALFTKSCCCQCYVPAEPRRPDAQQAQVTTTTTHVQQPVPMVHRRQHQRTQPILRTPTPHSLETELQIDLSIGMLVPDRYRPNRRQIGLSAGAMPDESLIYCRNTPPPYEQSQQGRF